ncbi:hypothetical protein TNCV_1911311 [Trichonephila clavipes]|nr:hypothetical protein TNCV_1911311 [Trichonephila clavipes]
MMCHVNRKDDQMRRTITSHYIAPGQGHDRELVASASIFCHSDEAQPSCLRNVMLTTDYRRSEQEEFLQMHSAYESIECFFTMHPQMDTSITAVLKWRSDATIASSLSECTTVIALL